MRNIEDSFSSGQRIDFQTAQAARLHDLDDGAVLRLAASEFRILVSHDKQTMPGSLASLIASGGTSPGVLLVIPQNAPIGEVVDTLILIWAMIARTTGES